ncbi:MAG: hypothetical protein M1605_02390 [Candidatus Thermoplasmatota archaeon]|nr:hypothetical protein [Candidatus Thermoplasmatota archaeon]
MSSGLGSSLNGYLSGIPISYPFYFILGIIGLIYIYRLAKTIHGEKFSETRIFMIPVIYAIFVSVTFIKTTQSEIIAAIIDTIIGVILGALLSSRVKIFERKGKPYYKRSITVVTLWTLFFTLKVMALLYYPQLDTLFVSSVLLTLVTGMIFGEAARIMIRFRHYRSQPLTNEN